MSISRKSAKKQHRCGCGRRFRTATRLAAHQQNCDKSELVEEAEALEASEASEASEADKADEPEFAPVPDRSSSPVTPAAASAAALEAVEAPAAAFEGVAPQSADSPQSASSPDLPEEAAPPVSLEWLAQHRLEAFEPEEPHPAQVLYREFFAWLRGEILGIFRCFCLLLSGGLVLASAVAVCFGLGWAWNHIPGQAPPSQRLSDASQTVVDFHRALMAGAQRSAASQLARSVDFSGMPSGDLKVVSIQPMAGRRAYVNVEFSVGARGVFSTIHDGYRWRIDGFAVRRDFASAH